MVVIKYLGLTMAILTGLVAYRCYLDVPEQVIEPWRVRIASAVMDFCDNLAWLISEVTGTPMVAYLQDWTGGYGAPQDIPELHITDLVIEGVPVRMYRRKNISTNQKTPAIVYLHGGGWVLGSIYMYEGMTSQLALETDMTVFAINFRKAGRNPYPAPFNDCYDVTKHILTRGGDFNIDSSKVTIMGDSAGGNLAAAVSLKLRDEAKKVRTTNSLNLQVLINPAMQAVTFNTKSYQQFSRLVLSQERMIRYWSGYMGIAINSTTYANMLADRHVSTSVLINSSPASSALEKVRNLKVKEGDFDHVMAKTVDKLVTDPYFNPLMAKDLSGLPKAYIVPMEFDPLRDEGVVYADLLKAAGVKVDLWVVKGQVHAALPYLTHKLWCQDLVAFVSEVSKYVVKHNV